jgi:hypothetical protein
LTVVKLLLLNLHHFAYPAVLIILLRQNINNCGEAWARISLIADNAQSVSVSWLAVMLAGRQSEATVVGRQKRRK